MWEQYIDLLAQCRFNVMDLHGIYNEAGTTFHNLLPYLVSVPEYPKVGSRQNQHENMADLRHLLAYAHDRGVQVMLMNYSSKVDGLSEKARQDYTRKAVARLVKKLHRLEWLGFRIGESGERGPFFAETYIGRSEGLRAHRCAPLHAKLEDAPRRRSALLAAGAPSRLRRGDQVQWRASRFALPGDPGAAEYRL